jgi:hypothetical protein
MYIYIYILTMYVLYVGPGKIRLTGLRLVGDGTQFTGLKPGDKLRPGRSPESYRVTVLSDTEGVLMEETGEPSPLLEPQEVWLDYDVLEHVDQVRTLDCRLQTVCDG